MTAQTLQLDIPLESLTNSAFEAFCEDIASMFGNAAECSADRTGQGPLSDLKKEFKKLASINHVEALGALDGTFQLLLDQGGVFVLAGVFVMLPEKRILETIRGGTLKDADYINDAIKEVGNLLVGSWDRIFREELSGHKHFKQTGTFVGSLWDNTDESVGITEEQDCHYVICTMKVDTMPEFKCAAVFPSNLFEEKTETDEAPHSPDSSVTDAPTEVEEKPVEEVENKPSDAEAANTEIAQPDDATPETDAPQAVEPTPEEEPAADTEPTSTESNPGPVAEAIRQLTGPSIETKVNTVSGAASLTALNTLTVAKAMNPAVIWADPEDTIESVLRQMQHHNVGYVLIGHEGQIDGIVSRSDITAAVSPYVRATFAHWRRPIDDASLQIRVKWFMSRPVHSTQPDAGVIDAMNAMMRHSVRGLPVLDAGGQVVGLLGVYDIFAALLGSAGMTLSGRPQQSPPAVDLG